MSYHAINPELEVKLATQRRNSTIMSIMIAFLLCVFLALGLTFILMSPFFKDTPKVITYSAQPVEELVTEVPEEVTEQVERKPSAPSSSMAKVIAAASTSPAAVPVPDVNVAVPSLDFGDNSDFGDGWGTASGSGSSGAGATVSFFKQKIVASRIAYVIDYSKSMRKKKQALMKKELGDSLKKLPPGIDYSLIFFAGPAWLPGDKVTGLAKRNWEIESKGKTYLWKKAGNIYTSEPKVPRVNWITSTKSNIRDSVELVESTELVYGTSWYTPLQMALEMRPRPDVIFLMTDGATANTQMVIDDLGEEARRYNVVINTIAINEPKAREAMNELAEMTKGQFSLVDNEGKIIEQN